MVLLRSGERGSALAAVLVLVVLLTVVGAAMVNATLTDITIAYNQGDSIAAQYAAEAGLSRAIYELSQDSGWTGTTAAIGDGQYVVSVSSNGTVRNITSTGTRGGGQRILKAAVKAMPQSAVSTVLANTTATIGSATTGLTVSNNFPSSGASAVHANNKLAAGTAMTINTAGANIIGGLTANGTISGVTCANWAWTCNAGASVRAIPELDVDSAATTSLKYRAQHAFDADGKYLYFKGGDTGRCNSGGAWAFTSTQQCWDYYVNSKSGTLGSGISNPVFFVEFAAGESTTYTTGGGGGGSITVNLPITKRGEYKNGISGSGTLTLNKPTGVVDNDVMIAAIAVRGSAPATPAGWTQIRTLSNGGTISLTVYRKVAASEGASYSWTVSGKASGGIIAYYNVDTTNPIDQDNIQTTPSALSHSTPSITTTGPNDMLVASFAVANQNNFTAWTPPGGMTEQYDTNSGGTPTSSQSSSEGAAALQDAAGATGQKTATVVNAGVGVTHLLALRPQTATVTTSSSSTAPTFRAAATGAGAPITISKPAGVVDGDVMIANIFAWGTRAAMTPPAGWTLIRNTTTDPAMYGSAYEQSVFLKVAAGEGASYTWSASGATSMQGGIVAYSGVDTANPVDAENAVMSPGPSASQNTSIPTPSVVTTAPNAMLVASFALWTNTGSFLTPPSGMTERYEYDSPNVWAESADQVQATPGLTSAKTATITGGGGWGFGHLLALRPAGGGGTTVSCGGSTYTETLCIRATPASPYPNSVLSQVTGAIVTFRRGIFFRGAASNAASKVTSLTISKPAGVINNDVMIAAIGYDAGTDVTLTPPAGWTLVRRIDNGTAMGMAVYRKVASGEGTSYTWNINLSKDMFGGIQAYSGVDTSTPIDVENGQATPKDTSHSTPSVTTTTNTMLVASFAIKGDTTWTPPAGMTEQYDISSGSFTSEGTDQLQAAAGATGAKTATATTSAVGAAHILALRPASGATVVGDIVFENMALDSTTTHNYTHTYQGSDPALLAAGKISMISSSPPSPGRTSTTITGLIYTFAGTDNPDASGNLQGASGVGFDLQHGANSITLTLSGLLMSNGSISLQDTGGTGTATVQYNLRVVDNLPTAFTASTAGSILVPLSWSSGD